ncbi:hypothetical protein TARUN_6648 [Trichoderma arundinaceum]|uniref:Uncharacterized protein n=1 Tax=Trichoderma arundinaceum TaxID=490622 RepID=A0A395NHL9_TRIAR|nr:hypothetical protein TARUN_6648 [Trichoderma arundinaceum]
MNPPPYERSDVPKNIKHNDDWDDKASISPWLMKNILEIGEHAERIRLTMEYTKRKRDIVKERDTALKLRNKSLAREIKKVKADAGNIESTRVHGLWSIAMARQHRIRSFIKMLREEDARGGYMYHSLIRMGTKEAQNAHKVEEEKIQVAFRKAARELDEEYKVLLDTMLDSNKQSAKVQI